MAGKYSKIIQDYCREEGINVPVGFKRHTASHLALIRFDGEEPKLVAKTFFKKEGLNHYISSTLLVLPLDSNGNLPAKVIDFKNHKSYIVLSDGSLLEQ